MRRLVLILALLAAIAAGSTLVIVTHLHHPAGESLARPLPVRFAWFYNPSWTGTSVSEVAAKADEVILTGDTGAQTLRDLRAAGYRGRVTNYVYAPACSDHPRAWWNQLCRGGEYTSLPPNFFLHDESGTRLSRPSVQGDGSRYWAWNPGDSDFRNWAIARMRWMLQTWGYDGIFLDEVWGYWHFANVWGNQTKTIREYPTEAAFREAWAGFITQAKAELGVPILANTEILEWHDRMLDGSMIEHFANGWGVNKPMSAERIREIWARLDATGKDAILVGRGERTDTTRMQFALACYLMIARPGVSFRYSNGAYDQFWWYPEYDRQLGRALAARKDLGGGVYRRRFEGGSITVDLTRRSAVFG